MPTNFLIALIPLFIIIGIGIVDVRLKKILTELQKLNAKSDHPVVPTRP